MVLLLMFKKKPFPDLNLLTLFVDYSSNKTGCVYLG